MNDTEPEDPDTCDPEQLFAALENAPITTARTIMRRRGFEPVAPEAIPPIDLKGFLWELLYALAAHRCFFEFTNGLADAALYQHLDEWLDHDFDDIPLSFEVNCHHDCSLALGAPGYHEAFEETEDPDECWDLDCPAPVTDRDRFLPHPPWPKRASGGKTELMGNAEFAADGQISVLEAEDPESAVDWQRPGAALQREDFVPASPDQLTPGRVRAALWELLHQLAVRGTFVSDTNHLTDSDLYDLLWSRVLGGTGSFPPARDLLCRAVIHFRDCGTGGSSVAVNRDWRLPRPPF
jgi:hypothetical protein